VVRVAMPGEPAGAALGEARLVGGSCDDLDAKKQAEARVKKMRDEVDARFREWFERQPACWSEYRERAKMEELARQQGFGYGHLALGAVGGAAYGAVGSASPPRVRMGGVLAAKSASGTNNQVAGVDEADLVKTDGRWVYLASNGALRIVEAMSPRVVSVTRVPGATRELFVEGDRAVVYSSIGNAQKRCTYGYDCIFAGDGSSTHVTVLDLADRAAPKIVRQIDLSGSLVAARRIGSAVHTVVADRDSPTPAYATWPADLDWCGVKEATVRARLKKLKEDNERHILAMTTFPTIKEKGVERPLCGSVLRTAMGDGQAFTTVVSIDLRDDAAPPTTATLQSRPGAVFASSDALYLSVVHQKHAARGRWYSFYPSVDEVSEVHKLRIGASAKETRYLGSGVVPCHVLNQFAMDEWSGYLRIATTRGRVPDPRVSSVLSVLAEGEGGNLVRVGAIENIAPGEDIRAVRFDGDRGYVVTFKKTDPLYVMDLYQPDKPAILGELKIPGFSTYMHRIDPDHLLSIGFDANDHGSFTYFDGVILQLFDVGEPTAPKLIHKEKIGTRGSSSEAATNHLAFNYFPDKGLLAFPMTICEGGGDGRDGDQLTFSGLLVYDVSVERGFKRLGGIDHGTRGAKCGTWWSNAQSVVKRSVFLDELVYSIAEDRVKVQRMGRFGIDVADLAMKP
jgi:hypothetical protein